MSHQDSLPHVNVDPGSQGLTDDQELSLQGVEQVEAVRPIFYWELSAEERADLDERHIGLQEEGFLAIDINHGRRLVAIACPWEDWPDVNPDPGHLEIERYSDNIACILQAALWDGYALQDVIERALHAQRQCVETSMSSIRR